jgi:hypothetical protein
MSLIFVDSNVLLDIMTEDPRWFSWSSDALSRCADSSALVINPIVYAEVSIRFKAIEDLEHALPKSMFERRDIPWEAAGAPRAERLFLQKLCIIGRDGRALKKVLYKMVKSSTSPEGLGLNRAQYLV